MYHNFFDQKGVNKMAQRKFIIDGGFKTDDASELLANLTMGGHILPDVDSNGTTGYDLGSTTAKWRDLYLSQGSLFINNQKVLEDDSGTIIVRADEDQSLTVKTTGTGVLALQSATTVNLNGTLQMAAGKNITDAAGNAVSFGDKLDMNNNLVTNIGTAVAGTDAANKSYVDNAVAGVINGAPGALDTLNELADAMGNDANFSTTVTNSIATNAAAIVTANSNIASNLAAIGVNANDITALETDMASANTAIGTKANTTYVDARETAITLAYESYADQAETDAKTYTDDRETAINSAWAAADGVVTAAFQAADTAQTTAITTAYETYADTAEADAISTAAADATTKADAALAAAQTYADTAEADAISSAASDATTKADAALASAQTYADTAEADAISTAAADATSKANAALASAQTYADTAEADAISSAAADATTKANAAQAAAISAVTNGAGAAFDTLKEIQDAMATDAELSSAISSVTSSAASTAAADATTKADAALVAAKAYADTAEADAISTASADATTKANAAQAAALAADTTYTAGNGLSLSGTEFLMSGAYTGSFTATGDITAYSDDSLKTNVQVIDGALGRVEAIRGVTFERIEDGSVSTGVIAQELKAVLPEAVHTDAEGVHSVAYGNITGLLIEAVKELSAQVEELKKK